MFRKHSTVVGAALLLALAIIFSSHLEAGLRAANGAFTFALIGDMPYGPAREMRSFRTSSPTSMPTGTCHSSSTTATSRMAAPSAATRPSSAASTCSISSARRSSLVPGDNEWTDCHRANNGAYEPTERLHLLRTLFFPTRSEPRAANDDARPAERESAYAAYRENVRWVAPQRALRRSARCRQQQQLRPATALVGDGISGP